MTENDNDVRKMFEIPLRRNMGGNQAAWTKEELLVGFQHFYKLNGHFPSAHEIDAFEYLPTARSIQRTYGGLVKLRAELLPDATADLTKGEHRSLTAKKAYANGRDYERAFFEYLTSKFKEIAIHEHKLIRPGNVSSDFFIYTTEYSGVVIDIFYANDIANLVNIVNIKLKRYVLIEPETYLVAVGNPLLTQSDIDAKTRNRRSALPAHVSVVTEAYFKDVILVGIQRRSKYGLR